MCLEFSNIIKRRHVGVNYLSSDNCIEMAYLFAGTFILANITFLYSLHCLIALSKNKCSAHNRVPFAMCQYIGRRVLNTRLIKTAAF